MRCENCGWDNPNENAKCVKCGAKLGKSSGGGIAPQNSERETVNSTQRFGGGGGGSSFDANKTAKGCPECGYPIRPGDMQCPQCGNDLGSKKTVPDSDVSPNPKPKSPVKGTVINVPAKDNDGNSVVTTSPEKRLVAFLVTYNYNPYGEFFPIYEGRNFVGTSSDMNAQIQGDDSVSSKHLSILYRAVDSKFKFKDEQSVNGTFINGELIDEGELQNSDIISIGATKLVFMIIPKIEAK